MGATMGGKGFNTALGGVMTGMVAVIDAMANMAHSRKESMVFLGCGDLHVGNQDKGWTQRGVGEI